MTIGDICFGIGLCYMKVSLIFPIIPVYHADGALKIASACLKFKLLKAECLALLGRVEVGSNTLKIFTFF